MLLIPGDRLDTLRWWMHAIPPGTVSDSLHAASSPGDLQPQRLDVRARAIAPASRVPRIAVTVRLVPLIPDGECRGPQAHSQNHEITSWPERGIKLGVRDEGKVGIAAALRHSRGARRTGPFRTAQASSILVGINCRTLREPTSGKGRPIGMANEFDPYREALVIETATVWPDEYDDLEPVERERIANDCTPVPPTPPNGICPHAHGFLPPDHGDPRRLAALEITRPAWPPSR